VVSNVDSEVHAQLSQLPSTPVHPAEPANQKASLPTVDKTWSVAELESYTPKVEGKEWVLSELDLEWIATGCYIMGCGGGGSPAPVLLGLRQLIRAGAIVRVIDVEEMDESGILVWGGGVGSPEVGEERLVNDL
jgi:hypothetical protein